MEQANAGENDTILLNTLLIDNKKYRALLHRKHLVWEKETSKNENTSVPLADILAVHLVDTSRRTIITDSLNSLSRPNPIAGEILSEQNGGDKFFLHIHYAKRDSNSSRDFNRWRKYTVKFYNSDYHIIRKWYETLVDILERRMRRPKNILMFINPYGGKRKALKTYEKYCKPLFELAGVEINCLISQRANQIYDILMSMQSLDQYDAICCVGGDGTFAEVFNGLIRRSIRDLNLDPQRPKYIPKPRNPIGIIPAGSTNTVVYCLHGTTDIKTSVIHIILGETRGLDLCSVCNNVGLVRLYASLMCYGYLGDIALDSERFRWMGPRRYEYSGFKKFLANRGYEIELTFEDFKSHVSDITSDEKDDGKPSIMCNIDCERCSNMKDVAKETHIIDYSIFAKNEVSESLVSSSNQNTDDEKAASKEREDVTDWKTVSGKYFMVAGANISCASSRSPNGLMPYCHLGDGQIDVIVIKHTNLFNLLRLLLRLNKDKAEIETLPFVEVFRTKKLIVKTLKQSNGITMSTCDLASVAGSRLPITTSNEGDSNKSKSQWNCDGEILYDTDVLVSSHRQLVNVFMRGSNPSSEDDNKKSCCCNFC